MDKPAVLLRSENVVNDKMVRVHVKVRACMYTCVRSWVCVGACMGNAI